MSLELQLFLNFLVLSEDAIVNCMVFLLYQLHNTVHISMENLQSFKQF